MPFHFAEDRAAIQLNLHLINQALMEGRIDVRTANAYTNNQRIALSNLRLGPLAESDNDNAIRRVILTPEGDEIATPHEKLEKDESPVHYKDCPCQSCAEQYRGAEPEQHHADCECGVCEPTIEECHPETEQSAAEAPAFGFGCHPERTGAPDTRDVRVTGLGSEGPAVSEPATASDRNHQSKPADLNAERRSLNADR